MITKPDTAPSPLSTGEELVDSIAKWLHEETEHPDSYPDHTWPETDRDDGRREGGWVKIVPQHAQAYFRDIARRLIATFPAALSQPPATEQIRREVIDSIPAHLNFLIGRGKTRPDEPLYGVQILDGLKVLAETENDDLCIAVEDAVRALAATEQARS